MSSLSRSDNVPLRVAQAVGITATSFLAGQIASTSYVCIPALLDSPAPLLSRQWKKVWLKARATTPKVSILLSILFGYLTSQSYKDKTTHRYFLTTAILLLLQLPYSFFLLGPLHTYISTKAEVLSSTALDDPEAELGVAREETVHALVDKWATLYLGKAGLVGAAAFSAVWGALQG